MLRNQGSFDEKQGKMAGKRLTNGAKGAILKP
jgi:hypothetical protein